MLLYTFLYYISSQICNAREGEKMSIFELNSSQQKAFIEELEQGQDEDAILKTIKNYIAQELLPIKKALNIIFSKLNINQSFFIPQELHINVHERYPSYRLRRTRGRRAKPIINNTVFERGKQEVQAQIKEQSLSLSVKSDSLQKQKPNQIKQIEYKTPAFPRGNNTTFNPTPLPTDAYMQQIQPENRQQWLKIYQKVKYLLESKKVRGQRGWFDFQKKILLHYVTIGTKFGINPFKLTKQLGISHSSFKRWRKYFK